MIKIQYIGLSFFLCVALSFVPAKEIEKATSLSAAVSAVVTDTSSVASMDTGGSQLIPPETLPQSDAETQTPSISPGESDTATIPEMSVLEQPDELQDTPLAEDEKTPDLSSLQPEDMSVEEKAKNLQYDIPMPWGHDLFEKYREYYLSDGGRKILLATMKKAAPFMDYIQSKVTEYGVPQELAYLPVIESAFSPFAVSRSGATGIWQFMKNSIGGYGMKISDWVDDRRDFMKSTDAALNKLIDNYKDLKDWGLAIAAYNAGLGSLRRAVNAAGGDTDFWNIYDKGLVSKQALDYVPKFLAVASILRYPDLYNLELPSSSIKWDAIPLERQVDIKLLASKAEIPLETLKLGNAELHYTITPPENAHVLKIPADKSEAVKAILSDPNTSLVHYEIYKVQQGDTLTAISKHYGISISMITKVNAGLKPDQLKIGQKLMIPLSLQPLHASSGDVGTGNASTTTYRIQKGDTLYGLARRYGTTASKLANLNGISLNSVLQIGQKIKVPAGQ